MSAEGAPDIEIGSGLGVVATIEEVREERGAG